MRALVSVSDKTGLVEFVKRLVGFGYEIISTGGTLKTLSSEGISVTPIHEVTGFPEILDGRVKTLHPHIYGGILADRQKPSHIDICDKHNISLIDLVIVNLYPFQETIADRSCTQEDAINMIDIGGPTLIRAAAKNFHSVGVVVNPDDYKLVCDLLCKMKGDLTEDLKKTLATKAFGYVAAYDIAISNYFQQMQPDSSKGSFELPDLKQFTLIYKTHT